MATTGGMLLSQYLDRYAVERGLSAGSKFQLECCVRSYGRYLGHDPSFCDLTADQVNRWLAEREATCSRSTRNNNRRGLLSLWNAASRAGLVELPRLRIPITSSTAPPPRPWSKRELHLLLAACRRMPPTAVAGILQPLWWEIFVRVAWDTVLRRRGILSIRLAEIAEHGVLVISHPKTSCGLDRQLSVDTVQAIQRSVPPNREFLLPWPHSDRSFLKHFKVLLIDAGLARGRGKSFRVLSASALGVLKERGA